MSKTKRAVLHWVGSAVDRYKRDIEKDEAQGRNVEKSVRHMKKLLRAEYATGLSTKHSPDAHDAKRGYNTWDDIGTGSNKPAKRAASKARRRASKIPVLAAGNEILDEELNDHD